MTTAYIVFPAILAIIDIGVLVSWVGCDYDWVTILKVIIGIHIGAFLMATLAYFTLWCYGAPIPPLF